MQSPLQSITHGMKVVDSRDHEIGTVDYVKLVETDAAGEPVAAGIEEDDHHEESIIESLAEAFTTDEIPEVLQQRLLHDGFIRMDAAGLFAADRYVLPNQISRVSGDRVVLNVTKADLQKAH